VNDARLRMVSETTREFMEATCDLEALLQTVADRLSAVIGDSCSILLLSEDRSTLVPSAFADRDTRWTRPRRLRKTALPRSACERRRTRSTRA
jgi:hypothetical protein